MLIGYNTNVPYKGKVYHIQTEDKGPSNPFILTLLYSQGAIIRSVKTSYAQLVGQPDSEEQLRSLMKHQHREIIRELISGKCDTEQLAAGAEPPVQPEKEGTITPEKEETTIKRNKGLDDILLEHISRKVKK
jgi:hypothetical protein